MPKPNRRKPYLILVFSIVFVLITFTLASLPLRLLDFENYLAGTRMLWRGENPYGAVEFFAPPWLSFLLLPLIWLPSNVSAAIWILLNFICIGGAVFLSLHWLNLNKKWHTLVLPVIIPSLMPGVLFSYITGQITPVIHLALLLAGWSIRTQPAGWLPALGLLVATLKPHIALFPVLLIVLELIRLKRWKPLFIAFGGLVIFSGISSILLKDWFSSIITAWLQGDFRGGEYGLISPGYIGLAELGVPFYVFLPLVVYTVWIWRKNGFGTQSFALALTSNLLLVPYNRSYDYVLLIFPLLSLAKLGNNRSKRIWGLALFATFILPFTSLSILSPVLLAIALLLNKFPADNNRWIL